MATILVSCHDAGGAEVVSAWVKAHPEHRYEFLLAGPAVGVFERKFSTFENRSPEELPMILTTIDQIITGTSWTANLERTAIAKGREHHIPCVSFIDHWCNYRQRFERDGICQFPDALWVGDGEALRIAKAEFQQDGLEIHLVPNPYYDEILREYEAIAPPDEHHELNVLYICEPVGAHTLLEFGDDRYYGYNEFDALEHFLSLLEEKGGTRRYKVRVRPHPSEAPDRYDRMLVRDTPLLLERIQGNSLFEDLRWADAVVGVASMALVIATLVNKKTYSCTPPNGTTMELHHPGIKRLTESQFHFA